jgi:uncharacterized membrane protein (UPF0127 family)
MSKNYFYEIIFSRVALIIFVVLMFIIMGIAKQSPATVAVVPKEDIGTRLLLPDGSIIKTEVVDTPALKSKGLSGRTSLGEHESMLFVFDSEGYYDFWMPDMSFALDMIWMDKDYNIVDITEDAKPMPGTPPEELPKYRSSEPAQYVLEVNSGFSSEHGLEVGDKLKLT